MLPRSSTALTSLALLFLTGCATARPWCEALAPSEGLALGFPAAPSVRRGHEGPYADSMLMSARDDGGRVFELALFTLTQTLDAAERAALMDSVEQGLSLRPGARAYERGIVALADRPALALSIAREQGLRGRHRVVYLDERRMLQLSVVGRDDDTTRAQSEAFFASFRTYDDPAQRCVRSCCDAPRSGR